MKHMLRTILCAMGIMLIAATAAGCSSKEDSAGASGAANENAAGETDVLKIAINSEPDNLDPMLSAATDTTGVMLNIFEGLLTFDPDGNFLPCLAEKYEIEDDGLTYRFHLKSGVKFHDGKEFTSDDVRYTYEKLTGMDGGTPLNQLLADELEAVETPDESTVVFRLRNIDAGFLCRCILAIQEKDYGKDSTAPVGTGPFMFKEYLPGQKLVMVKNPDYGTVESRIPDVDQVEFRIMTDDNAILMALKSHDLDIAAVSPVNAGVVGDKFEIVEGLRNNVQLMALNNSREPFNNEKVRQAVNYAINKEEIINIVTKGYGQELQSFLSPRMKFYYNDELKGYETDPEKAKALLTEAGYPDGISMTITVPSNYQIHVDTSQVIKSQLEKAGIHAEIQLVEWAQWLDQVYKKADYEASIVGHSGKLDPQDFLNRFTSTYEKNYFKFSDPEYDRLVADAAATTDEEERARLYKECQQMLCDHAAAVYIQDPYLIYAVNKEYTNMQIYPVTFFDMGSIRKVQ